jgi:ADP-heptose:LPS heptosyltransferase
MADFNESSPAPARSATRGVPPFPYAVELELGQLVPVDVGGAVISAGFRHFHKAAIELGLGEAAGQLNLGFILFREGEMTHVFEGRCLFETARIAPATLVRATLFIPRAAIACGVGHRLMIDMVCERFHWFREFGDYGRTLAVGFCEAADAQRLALRQMQLPTLQQTLIRALTRLTELEQSERRLLAERNEAQARLASLTERMARDIDDLAAWPPPAALLDRLIRAQDPVQRRDRWLRALTATGATGEIFGLMPHDGEPGPLRILVQGSGGLGDMLYTSAVVRELHAAFAPADIFVLYENTSVEAVFGTNPHVVGALSLQAGPFAALMHAICSLDIFDLVAEVRYAVTYFTPPLSRVPMSFRLRANAASAEWQQYVRYDWPHLNNLFANAVTARGLNKLDLVGLTAQLPIDRHADIDLFIPLPDLAAWPTLTGAAYVTVHHGADRAMAAAGGVQTKNLPAALWARSVALLQAQGLLTVQLGEAHEQPIEGIDLDLRGMTTFRQTAAVIKAARVHLDTEGGLVHVARAVNTASVVLFGPTPAAFFGYPQNENVAPRLCGNCWWVTRRWSIDCPRGLASPECMHTQDPSDIAARAVRLARPDWRIAVAVAATHAAMPDAAAALRGLGLPEGDGLLLVGPDWDPLAVADAAAAALPRATILVAAEHLRNVLEARPDCLPIRPYSAGNIPLSGGRAAWALALGLDPRSDAGVGLVFDLLRCVATAGACDLLVASPGEPLAVQDWLAGFGAAAARCQGGGYALLPAGGASAGDRASAFRLRLTRAADAPVVGPQAAAGRRRRRLIASAAAETVAAVPAIGVAADGR